MNIAAAVKKKEVVLHVQNDIFDLFFDEEIASFFSAAEHDELAYQCPELSNWGSLDYLQRRKIIQSAVDGTERVCSDARQNSVAILLQIALGVPQCTTSQNSQLDAIRENAELLLGEGVLHTALTHLFNLCLIDPESVSSCPSIDTNFNIRSWAGVTHCIVETGRHSKHSSSIRNRISKELQNFSVQGTSTIELFLQVIHQFVNGERTNIPIKKMLILCWKTVMLVLGDLHDLSRIKYEKRIAAGLSDITPPEEDEDPLALAVEATASKIERLAGNSEGNVVVVPPVGPGDDELTETETDAEEDSATDGEVTETEGDVDSGNEGDVDEDGGDDDRVGEINSLGAKRAEQPRRNISFSIPAQPPGAVSVNKGTLRGKLGSMRHKKKVMRRKVTPKQFEALKAQIEDRPPTQMFWDGFQFRPPMALEEAYEILKANCYTSLKDLQIAETKKEYDERIKFRQDRPNPEATVVDSSTEKVESLFRNTVQHWAPLTISLLKLKFAAISAYGDGKSTSSINLNCELQSLKKKKDDDGKDSVLALAKDKIERARHGEIILKALSSLLLLLLKHLHLNHVYQMEYLASRLCDANGIVLILKSLNVNVKERFSKPINQSIFEIFWGADAKERSEALNEPGVSARNLQSALNLLRVLQKLTKGKHSRILMLVKNKTETFLRKLLAVQSTAMQLYVLKLIKSQVPFLGKSWKKYNMQVISAIDAKVTHHMVDDWVYANAQESADASQEDEELFNEAAKRYIQRYVNNHADSLEQLLSASTIFDMYKLSN